MISSRNAIRRAAPGVFWAIRRGLQYRSRLGFNESPATEIELKGSRRTPVLELSLVRGFVVRKSSVHRQIYFWSLTLRVLTLSSMDSSWFYALAFIGLIGIPLSTTPDNLSIHSFSQHASKIIHYMFHIRRVVLRQGLLEVLPVLALGFNWSVYWAKLSPDTAHAIDTSIHQYPYLEFQLLDLHTAVHA